MATKARQQYFADEVSLSKEKREFSIADEIQQKIDSIEPGAQVNKIETVKVNGTALVPDANKAVNIDVPEVIDNLYTVDSDNALSAKQGKLLYDYIQNIASRGRFLSNWNSATGLPMTNPSESPYPYKSGDYFVVSNVATSGGTNYRPDGSSYIIGQASTVVETDSVDVSDFYFYDGTNWLLLKNSGRSGAVDSSLSTTSTNPVENRVITNALNGKQETLIAGSNIQIAADGKTISATDTTYSAGANISIDANNEISAVDTTYTAGTNVQISNQNVISATDTKYTAGTGINIDANNVISNTQTSAEWGNITGTLSDQTDLQTALNAKQDNMVILKYGISTWNDFITAYNKNGVIYCRASSNSNPASGSQTRLAFMAYVNNETTPTEVEFQYYRSRSSHSTAANVLDEVYVYKLVPADGGTWTVTQRDTAAKPIAGTGIGLTYNASGMTISADTTVLATKTDLNSKQDTLVSGTNIKTINSNSLLGSGNLTLNDIKVSATAPSSPTEGMTWYDTTNDVLKVYDGTNWNVTGKEYNAGEGIAIGTAQDYSAMRGPCPRGFHVPLSSELEALCEVVTTDLGLDSDGITMGTYLKMPIAGCRTTDSSIKNVGMYAYYWTATPHSVDNVEYIIFSSDSLFYHDGAYRASAFSIRGFRDTPVIPDNSWTTLYDGSSVQNGAGVFWNPSFGLISTSSDGQNWITIQDKNLGATAVYNYGDTLSEANCGKFYQRGNNYGFPRTGTVTTSATQVDASNYGPGNYYSSDTFITRSASLYDWSSVQNDDLWGGVTGVVAIDNAITNTGVLSVNGQTGHITVEEPIEYAAGEGIAISTVHPDNQGPCEDGFHIPLHTELQALFSAWTSLGFTNTQSQQFLTYLHIPVGRRNFTGVSEAGDQACLWGADGIEANGEYWVMSIFDSTEYPEDNYIEVTTIWGISQCFGYPIRAFKDTPIAPDNSWAVEYQGTGNAGIFHNSTLGLISVSSDGTNWITFKDKNEGATTVYNYGDTITDTNLGNVYQRGNNYGFPFTGNITTSSGTVDASNYGPGNYYSSSTFITRTNQTYSQPRDNSGNRNLWGGVSQGTWIGGDGNTIVNTGVLSVNGQTGAVTVNDDVKVFEVPAVNDDISDMITRISAGKGVILHEMVSGTDAFYKVDYHDDVTQEITASLLYSYNGGYARYYTIVYNYSTKKVITKTPSLTYFFAPETAGTQGQVLTKTASGYEWANASGGFELAPNSPLTPRYRRYGTQAQYEALTQYYTDEAGDTVYFTI